MASNEKVKARATERKLRGDRKFVNVLVALDGVLGTGEELPNYRTPRGQAFTRKPTGSDR